MNREILSQRLKKARIEAGLRQEDLAKCLGVPISAVSILEAGNRKLDVLEFLKICQILNKNSVDVINDILSKINL